jgi:hypothetical protein
MKVCREGKVFGKVLQGRLCGFKGLIDVIAASPTFVFGKVSIPRALWAAPEKETGLIDARLSAPGRGGRDGAGGT